MQRLYKRKETYWASIKVWTGSGWHWIQRSTGQRSRKAAEFIAAQFERDYADPSRSPAHQTTLSEAFQRFFNARAEHGRSEHTITMYRRCAGHFVRLWGEGLPLQSIDARKLDDFISARIKEGASRNTLGKELTALRGLLKLAKRRKEFKLDLGEVLPEQWSTGYKPRERALTQREAEALLPELISDRGAHVAFLLATAARWSESLSARATDIDLQRGEVRIRGTKTERANRTIPVVDWAWPLLRHTMQILGEGHGPIFRPWKNVRHDLAAACRRAGIAPVTPNDLRRTCATWLRAAGVEPHLIAAFLGHADSRMVERVYGRLPADALRDLLRARLKEGRHGDVIKNQGNCLVPIEADENRRALNPVPRGRIELPTRGFSAEHSRRPHTGKASTRKPSAA